MFGRKCSLCGGKLDSNNVCTLCGLDNSKSDKYYRINRSDCDGKPLTHVHEEKKPKKAQKKVQKKNGLRIIASVFSLIFILIGILGSLSSAIGDIFGGNGEQEYYDDYSYEEIDPYEYVDEELPEDGEEMSYILTSGSYIVGVHLPAGNYEAETSYDYDAVRVDDYEHGLYLYEYAGNEEKNYLDDLRLYSGAVVTISTETTVTLHTENGQVADMYPMENPVTDKCMISSVRRQAGDDLDAGVYDLELAGGEGTVTIRVYDEEYDDYMEYMIYMGEGYTHGEQYKNLVIPEGAEISCDSGMQVMMTPSPVIESTDYMSFYNRY